MLIFQTGWWWQNHLRVSFTLKPVIWNWANSISFCRYSGKIFFRWAEIINLWMCTKMNCMRLSKHTSYVYCVWFYSLPVIDEILHTMEKRHWIPRGAGPPTCKTSEGRHDDRWFFYVNAVPWTLNSEVMVGNCNDIRIQGAMTKIVDQIFTKFCPISFGKRRKPRWVGVNLFGI